MGSDSNSPFEFKTRLTVIFLQLAHRLGAIALLATLGTWAMVYLAKDCTLILAIACGAAEAGLLFALLARMMTASHPTARRESNSVAIFNLVLFVLAIYLMLFTRLDDIRSAAGQFFSHPLRRRPSNSGKLPPMNPEHWMREAIAEAHAAHAAGDVPIGCVIVNQATGHIIGRGRNRREIDSDASAHAEIVAIRQAGKKLTSWRLIDCVLIVTLEPCPMCAGAIVNARIPKLVYAATIPKPARSTHCIDSAKIRD